MDLAHRVKEITGSSSEIITIPYEEAYGEGFEDMHRRSPDINKIRNTIGFKPKTRLDEIIKSVANWVKETGRA